MVSPLTIENIQDLYGSLRHVLHECPATKIRVIAGAAGGVLEESQVVWTKAAQELGGQRLKAPSMGHGWSGLNQRISVARLKHLAQELIDFYTSRGMEQKVQRVILKNGYRFENGGFVPVDATGQVPA